MTELVFPQRGAKFAPIAPAEIRQRWTRLVPPSWCWSRSLRRKTRWLAAQNSRPT